MEKKSKKQPGMDRLQLHYEEKELLLEEVMDDYGERLIRLAYTYVKDWGEAEDIVQEVFTTCYTKLDTFRGEGSLKSWLYAITVNKCKDHLKSWFRRNIHPANLFEWFIPSQEKTPELLLVVEDEYTELAERILELPVKYREIIMLFYQEELSIQEICTMLHVNASTVKSRLHRARKLLKSSLSQHAD